MKKRNTKKLSQQPPEEEEEVELMLAHNMPPAVPSIPPALAENPRKISTEDLFESLRDIKSSVQSDVDFLSKLLADRTADELHEIIDFARGMRNQFWDLELQAEYELLRLVKAEKGGRGLLASSNGRTESIARLAKQLNMSPTTLRKNIRIVMICGEEVKGDPNLQPVIMAERQHRDELEKELEAAIKAHDDATAAAFDKNEPIDPKIEKTLTDAVTVLRERIAHDQPENLPADWLAGHERQTTSYARKFTGDPKDNAGLPVDGAAEVYNRNSVTYYKFTASKHLNKQFYEFASRFPRALARQLIVAAELRVIEAQKNKEDYTAAQFEREHTSELRAHEGFVKMSRHRRFDTLELQFTVPRDIEKVFLDLLIAEGIIKDMHDTRLLDNTLTREERGIQLLRDCFNARLKELKYASFG